VSGPALSLPLDSPGHNNISYNSVENQELLHHGGRSVNLIV